MTTTNRLCYTVSKRYIQARTTFEKKRAEIINGCKKKQQKAKNGKRVMLAVLDAGLSVNDVIHYGHSNGLGFSLMLLLFGAVVFISGTDLKKLKDFINKNDQSDKF